MPKSSLPALVFNGVSLSIIRQNNQTYFSASDIAKSLGYQSDDAISRIYRRNADEFTSDMSQTVNLTVSGNYQKTVRLFSLRGAHLVAMFSRTPIAKEFRKWVLDVLDRETSQRTLIQDIDVKSLLLENHYELTAQLPAKLLNAIDKKAWEMTAEVHSLFREYLTHRMGGHQCKVSEQEVIDVPRALETIKNTTIGNALAHQFHSEIRSLERSIRFISYLSETALQEIRGVK